MSIERSNSTSWPREIWAFEVDHSAFETSGTYALSEFATMPRFEGDNERDRDSKRYIDADILESSEKYHAQRYEKLSAENQELKERLSKLERFHG